MKTIFTDLHLYEIILLFLGIFLFLILSLGLLYYIIKKEEIKKLLFFFPIPIVMIGYPSLKEITISADKVAFSKYQEEYIQNPNDTIIQHKLEELTEKLEERAQTPEDIVQISKAKLLLGDPEEAIKYADKAIKREKEIEKPIEIVSPNNGEVAIKAPILTQAIQLKKLAKVQDMSYNTKDTIAIETKLKNIKVDPRLLGTKDMVTRNVIKKMKTKQ